MVRDLMGSEKEVILLRTMPGQNILRDLSTGMHLDEMFLKGELVPSRGGTAGAVISQLEQFRSRSTAEPKVSIL